MKLIPVFLFEKPANNNVVNTIRATFPSFEISVVTSHDEISAILQEQKPPVIFIMVGEILDEYICKLEKTILHAKQAHIPTIIILPSKSERKNNFPLALFDADLVISENTEPEKLAKVISAMAGNLEESDENNQFSDFLNTTSVGLWCFKPAVPVDITLPEDEIVEAFYNSVCIDCNLAYAKMLQTTPDILLGIKLSDLLPKTDENTEYLRKFIQNGFSIIDGVTQEISASGDAKYFSNSFSGTIKNGFLTLAWGTQIDITKCRIADDALTESKRQYSSLIENLPGVVYRCSADQDRTMKFLSKNVLQLTGYQSEDFIRNSKISFRDIIAADDRNYVVETISNSLQQGRSFTLEYRIKTNQGNTKWLWEQGGTARIKGSDEPLLEGFIIDITQRKMAEIRAEIMHNIAIALSSTSDLSELTGFIRQEIGKIVNAKIFMLALYDDIKDEFSMASAKDEQINQEHFPLGKTISALVIRNNKSLLLKGSEIDKLQKEGKIERFGSPAKSWLGVPLTAHEKVIGIIILQDYDSEDTITAYDRDLLEFISAQIATTIIKKKSEDEIRKLLQSVEQNPNPIVITSKNGAIEYVNQKFTSLTGFEAAEVIGKIPHILDGQKTDPVFCERIWAEILAGKEWRGEYFNIRKSGQNYWELASITPIKDQNDKITHFVYVKEDITSRIEMEKDLMAAKIKAEESDRLKTAFLANMSHEIRTPMNAIIGFAEMLREADYTPEEHLRFTTLIGENGRKLLAIIDDIIDIAKIESGQLNISTLRCSANKILFDNYYIFRELKAKLGKDHIEFRTTQLIPDQNLQFVSDPQRINQVIINLLSNALKYTFEGFIELGYKLVPSNLGQNICFYVKDSGVGIPKEKNEIIFDKFRQIEENHTRVTGGAGLGLAISKNIARLMGGDITVESEIGKGSTFNFSIPYHEIKTEEKYQQLSGVDREGLNWSDHAILIAEDEDSNFQLLDLMLRKSKVKVMRAYNGKEAVEFVRSGKDFDLVLMDVRMPVMNGYDATAAIKEINPDLPVVAQTAFALSGDREISINSGCDEYISKPIKSDELFRILSKFLR